MRGKPYKGGRPSIDLKLLKSFSLSFSLSVLSFSLSLFLCSSSSFLEASARLTKSFKVKGCGSLIGSLQILWLNRHRSLTTNTEVGLDQLVI